MDSLKLRAYLSPCGRYESGCPEIFPILLLFKQVERLVPSEESEGGASASKGE